MVFHGMSIKSLDSRSKKHHCRDCHDVVLRNALEKS